MNWESDNEGLVNLCFAMESDEVGRLLPRGLLPDVREYEGDEYGFFLLSLMRCRDVHERRFNRPRFHFPMAYLGLCVVDPLQDSSMYVKKTYAPWLYGWMMRLLLKYPVQSMDLEFPHRAHPGGEHRWKITGDGAGELHGRIDSDRGLSGRLREVFDSDQDLVDFYYDRRRILYGSGSDSLTYCEFSLPGFDYYPMSFEQLELGFLSSALERHTFPETIMGSFFVPGLSLNLDGPSTIENL